MNESDIDAELVRLRDVERIKKKEDRMKRLREKVEPGILDGVLKEFGKWWKKI